MLGWPPRKKMCGPARDPPEHRCCATPPKNSRDRLETSSDHQCTHWATGVGTGSGSRAASTGSQRCSLCTWSAYQSPVGNRTVSSAPNRKVRFVMTVDLRPPDRKAGPLRELTVHQPPRQVLIDRWQCHGPLVSTPVHPFQSRRPHATRHPISTRLCIKLPLRPRIKKRHESVGAA
jgi:hypothetical protein